MTSKSMSILQVLMTSMVNMQDSSQKQGKAYGITVQEGCK